MAGISISLTDAIIYYHFTIILDRSLYLSLKKIAAWGAKLIEEHLAFA